MKVILVDFGLKLILVDYQHKLFSKKHQKTLPNIPSRPTYKLPRSPRCMPCFSNWPRAPSAGRLEELRARKIWEAGRNLRWFPRYETDSKVIPRSWYCWWFRNPANSPVVDVVVGSWSHYLQGVFYIQNGGWPWDFWTSNSTFDGGWCLLVT